MVKKSRGVQAKTRQLFKRGVRERTTVNKILEEFKEGSKVIIKIDPSSQKGRPFRRFQGKMGTVIEKRGVHLSTPSSLLLEKHRVSKPRSSSKCNL